MPGATPKAAFSRNQNTRAYALAGQTCGGQDEITLAAAQDLGVLHIRQGRLDDDADLLRACPDGRRMVRGADHPNTAAAASNLAVALKQLRRFDEAESLLRNTLAKRRTQLGLDHFDTTSSMYNLATVLHAHGQVAEAGELVAEAAWVRRRTLGDDHRHTLLALNDQALYLLELGQVDQAESILRGVYQTRLEKLGPDSRDTIASRFNLVMAWTRQGRTDESVSALDEVIAAARRADPEGHPAPLLMQSRSGEYLASLRRFDEAESPPLQSYQALRDILGADHRHTRGQRTIGVPVPDLEKAGGTGRSGYAGRSAWIG